MRIQYPDFSLKMIIDENCKTQKQGYEYIKRQTEVAAKVVNKVFYKPFHRTAKIANPGTKKAGSVSETSFNFYRLHPMTEEVSFYKMISRQRKVLPPEIQHQHKVLQP